jgi:hypothetical protein
VLLRRGFDGDDENGEEEEQEEKEEEAAEEEEEEDDCRHRLCHCHLGHVCDDDIELIFDPVDEDFEDGIAAAAAAVAGIEYGSSC